MSFQAWLPLALSSLLAAAAPLPKAAPAQVGVSAERLGRVRALVQRYIDRGEIAGAVSMVARHGKVIHFEAQGVSDLETKAPLRTDAIFQLASMTKPFTSLAVMMLHEEGRFLLDDPISKFLPEFKDMKVAVANAPNERAAGAFRLEPAARPITIRHLLTHTSGIVYGTSGPVANVAKQANALRKPNDVLADYTKRLAALPLNFNPGDRWEYGLSVNVLGRLVEVVSGQSLDEFFRRHIFEPLGMRDTFSYLPDDRIARFVSPYKPKDGGAGLEKRTELGPASRTRQLFTGGGGLAGTAEDYMRFCQMLIAGGQLDGTRLVSRKTIEAMTANQIGPLTLSDRLDRNYGFGLGFRVRREVGQSATLGSVGEYGWGGALGTQFWVDPAEKMVGILMIQLYPNDHLNLRHEFQNAVTQAIVD